MKAIVCCQTPWFWDEWKKIPRSGEWLEIQTPAELTEARVAEFKPDYIFFPHWSHKVPATIHENYNCVCFHSTPLPFGRGGSPVQNMILMGHKETRVTALRMVEAMDAGPIYLQKPLSLYGGGDEIFIRIAKTIVPMIHEILATRPTPVPQTGEPTPFKRRKPDQSELSSELKSLDELFDFIRMLDADGYPKAFLKHGNFRLEFTRAALRRDGIESDVKITLIQEGQ